MRIHVRDDSIARKNDKEDAAIAFILSILAALLDRSAIIRWRALIRSLHRFLRIALSFADMMRAHQRDECRRQRFLFWRIRSSFHRGRLS